ncbi:beta-ketoacyl-[acyl-carrier-protein] synthase II [Methylophaga sp. 42_25_T18]|nr:beta-ketoacyl-[acyl-carrier-protein] synthase II [Methylophaga sp. 42_25_T18]
MTKRCYLNAVGILCSAGDSPEMVKKSLLNQRTTLTMSSAFSTDMETVLPLGIYQGELPELTLTDKKWQSRNNQFAIAALKQINNEVQDAITQFGAHRVGVIIGTSTSGTAESEAAIEQWVQTGDIPPEYDYGLQGMGAPAQYVAEYLGVQGPSYGISTACSSGAKALASARRLIRAGICDAVIAGGVDTLCKLTVQGFSSLDAVSDEICNPFSNNRKGINVGEGAALFLMTSVEKGVELLGVGEDSDAYHLSAPDPTGAGAVRCMTAAVNDANLIPDDIGYVNLHGTSTKLNDQMESIAMHAVFGPDTLCSSTKPFVGHTLGAAGVVEAAICYLTLESGTDDFVPVQLWDGVLDPELPKINLVDSTEKLTSPLNYVLSNSFAFGGSSISLLFGRISND